MNIDVCNDLGIEYPLFAFSHCRDVVAAVSRAGGMGVLGVSRHSAAELAVDLAWIKTECRGRPFGVDLIFPSTAVPPAVDDTALPAEQVRFVRELVGRFEVPPPADTDSARLYSAHKLTTDNFVELAEVSLAADISLLVSALGSPPASVAQAARSQGVRLGALVGSPRHAEKQVEAGMDILIAQGHEAGGHVGKISSMVLVPQVVDVAGGRPVLAAGGIADGRQMAAAMALGAQGVWLGSVWLTTPESDLQPGLVRRLLAATSADTVVSRSYSGKPARLLRTPWVDAWEGRGAPAALPTPLQGQLVRDAMTSAVEHGIDDVLGTPVGQVVGMMNRQETCAGIVNRIMAEFVDAGERVAGLLSA
ncbi:nitronate monooxygenase [Dactylosporangium roseum]|uniref:Nitronate monooxygenase n=1 Tax=Dactylosporangium roseum TaxID=47989 RepID=A0ABY5YYU2_9ACTN|nr:nitronate monooxygenase [Dactylosporangium roseum]UWZ34402.1 nitronate monooxygenase [Dactylosporangium roseum]